MFEVFRQNVKTVAKKQNLTYAQIAKKAGVTEGTIKTFMCGANDSRRIAEKIADVIGVKLLYNNGEYSITESRGDK